MKSERKKDDPSIDNVNAYARILVAWGRVINTTGININGVYLALILIFGSKGFLEPLPRGSYKNVILAKAGI
ncbi:MAG: hypothetical protein RIF33_18780 [Cyclobacteriaceae bacterium]